MGKLDYYFFASKASLGQVLSIFEKKSFGCEMTFAPPEPRKRGYLVKNIHKIIRTCYYA